MILPPPPPPPSPSSVSPASHLGSPRLGRGFMDAGEKASIVSEHKLVFGMTGERFYETLQRSLCRRRLVFGGSGRTSNQITFSSSQMSQGSLSAGKCRRYSRERESKNNCRRHIFVFEDGNEKEDERKKKEERKKKRLWEGSYFTKPSSSSFRSEIGSLTLFCLVGFPTAAP